MREATSVDAAIICSSLLLREIIADSLAAAGIGIPCVASNLDDIPVDCEPDVVVVVEATAGEALPNKNTFKAVAERFDRWLIIGPGGEGSTLHQLRRYREAVSSAPFDIGKEDIPHAVHLAARTDSLCVSASCESCPTKEMIRLTNADLDQEQWKILELLSVGATNKQIANELDCEEGRIKGVIRRLLIAINANNRTQAAVIASRAGL